MFAVGGVATGEGDGEDGFAVSARWPTTVSSLVDTPVSHTSRATASTKIEMQRFIRAHRHLLCFYFVCTGGERF